MGEIRPKTCEGRELTKDQLASPEHGNERGLWATGATLVAFALLIARFPADTDIFDGAPAGAAGRGQKREGGELSRLLFFS